MKKAGGALLCMVILWIFSGASNSMYTKYIIKGVAQGTTYQITYFASTPMIGREQTDSVLRTMDEVFSRYYDRSWIIRFNRSPYGLPIHADMLLVWEKAREVNQLTEGIGDIAINLLTREWEKGKEVPKPYRLRKLKSHSGMDLVTYSGDSLKKKDPKVQLDTDGIAQGYSVDKLGTWLEEKGIENYVIELGGEVLVKGCKPGTGEKMRIAIEAPMDWNGGEKYKPTEVYLSSGALTTSGNYRKFLASGGKRRSHIIDPRTGYPVMNELISVTLYASDALTADAYDHAVFAMGLAKGMQFVDAHPFLSAYFIFSDSEGKIRDTASRQFYVLTGAPKHCIE